MYWKGLTKIEQDTISKIPEVNIKEITKNMTKHCGKGPQPSSSGPPHQSATSRGKKQYQALAANSTSILEETTKIGGTGLSGSMNVD